MNRRQFLTGLGVSSSLIAVLLAEGSLGKITTTPILERLEINSKRLPAKFNGFKIGFLTDIHFGAWLSDSALQSAYQSILEQDLDILLLGGDYLVVPDISVLADFGPDRNEAFTAQSIKRINKRLLASMILERFIKISKPYLNQVPTYAVLGNHDRWMTYHTVEPILTAAGVSVLTNRELEIFRDNQRIILSGTDDYLCGIPKLPGDPKSDLFRILLTHNPDMASVALKLNYNFDLALCGHTHAGQIKSGLLGGMTFNIEDLRFAEGLVQVGTHSVYTSRGLGMVQLPIRINCPPEVTVVELKSV